MSRNNPHSADDRFQELIALLADGRFHGGDELGDSLGVSRAAVWKQIQKLQESGLDIQSVRGKGTDWLIPWSGWTLSRFALKWMMGPGRC
mgnify:CR=1 FL=1